MAKNGLNYNKMKLLKYIFLLLPFCSLAQTPTGTSRAGYLVLNEAQTFSPSVRLHVNGTARINGSVTLPYYSATNGVLTVNGSGLVGVTAGIVPPAVGASGTLLTSNGTVPSWNLLTNSNVSNTANITATKLGTGVISNSEFNALDGVITTKSIQSQFYERIRKDSLTISLNSGTGYLSLVGISGGSLVNLNLWGDPKYLKLTGGTLTGTLNGTGINSSGTNYIRGSNRFYGGMWFRDSTNANTYTNYKISTKTQSGNIKTLAIDYDYQFNGSGLSANDIFVIKGNSVGIRTADPTVAGLQVTGDVQYSGVLYTPLTTGHATINGAGLLGSSATIPSTDITGNFALNRITTPNIGRIPYSNGTILTESASLNFGTGTYGNTLFASNLQIDGTSVFNGTIGVPSVITGANLAVNKNITGSTTGMGISNTGQIQSDVTSLGAYYTTTATTQATSFTLPLLYHYSAFQGTFGAGSSVTSQMGFRVASTLTGATNNFAFYGDISIGGTNRWNFYANGTAPNYFNGLTGFGSGKTAPTYAVDANGTVAANRFLNQGSAPTIAAGAGAGTGPTVSITAGSTDNWFQVNVTTGTTPTALAAIATITLNGGAYSTLAPGGCTPSNAATGLLTGIYFTNTTSTLVINANAGALAPTTAYIWDCYKGGK